MIDIDSVLGSIFYHSFVRRMHAFANGQHVYSQLLGSSEIWERTWERGSTLHEMLVSPWYERLWVAAPSPAPTGVIM